MNALTDTQLVLLTLLRGVQVLILLAMLALVAL
jgi:hypothetical protein